MRTLAVALLGFLLGPSTPASPGQTVSLSASDFLELERTTCLGSCPAYTVRIQADGSVTWNGKNYVKVIGTATASVPAAQARALIEKAIANGFWDLNASYSARVTDNPTYFTTLHVGSREKRVSNYYNMAPSWVKSLEDEIDRLANSTRWINGDPAAEIFAFVPRRDVKAPTPSGVMVPVVTRPTSGKSGTTPLMLASAKGDLTEVNKLLAAKQDPNAQDASGWTPLIYAVFAPGTGGDTVISALLAAGANPSLQSAMGQTAAMAAVTNFYSPMQRLRLLVDAGADLNAQDKNGQTALMFAANPLMTVGDDSNDRFKELAELVTFLRLSGARTDLRDVNGQSVLDQALNTANTVSVPRAEYLKTAAILEGVTPGKHPSTGISGRVIRPAETLEGYSAATVVLERVGNGTPTARAAIAADGAFQFHALPPGVYAATLLPSASLGQPPTLIAVSGKDVTGLEIKAPTVREVIIHASVEGGGTPPAFGLIVATALAGPKFGASPRIQADALRPFPPNLLPFIQANAGALAMQAIRMGGTTQDEGQIRIFLPTPWSRTVFMSEPLPGGDFRITLPEGDYAVGAVVPNAARLLGRGGTGFAFSVTAITHNGVNVLDKGLTIRGSGPAKVEVTFKAN